MTGKIPNLPAALVISGGNIQPEIHQALVAGQSGESQPAGGKI
jgi:hypothetical protein